jgi:hypothetical protein
MAFAELSATGEDGVGTFGKTPQDKGRIETSGAHHPDGPQIRRILVTGNPGTVCGGIAAPVAEKTQDFGVEIFLTHNHYSSIFVEIAKTRLQRVFVCNLLIFRCEPVNFFLFYRFIIFHQRR